MTGCHSTTAGWREWVALPEQNVEWIKAKLDTGARTSSLHAFGIEEFEREGASWARFGVHPWQRSSEEVQCEAPLVDRRTVRSSSGHTGDRPVVRMAVRLLGQDIHVEVTLTGRDEMGFRMLIGREALRQGFLVDSGRSYLGGRPKRAVRRRNRGVSGAP